MRLEEQIYSNLRNLEEISASVLYIFQSKPLGDLFKSEPLRIGCSPRGIKLFGEEIKIPLMRFDYPADQDGSKPEKHLHCGTGYFGRNGNEAADILAEIIRLTKRPITFSPYSEDKDDES
jgi:hypothetical protein